MIKPEKECNKDFHQLLKLKLNIWKWSEIKKDTKNKRISENKNNYCK